jgi:hypothetical protein
VSNSFIWLMSPDHATVIAIGIGLHNFGEGLAIGAAYAVGAAALGTFLVVGFIIQNITEGLGIVVPGLVIASQEEAAGDAYTGFSHTGGEIETPSGAPVPEGGCKHQANLGINPDSPPPGEDGYWSAGEGELMPDTPGLHSRVDDLLGESYSAGMEDPAVEAANEAWKECAGLSGYTVDPGGASEVMGDGGDAVLSAECLDSSGYLDAFVAAETRVQEDMVEEHRAELEERKEQLDAELAAARAVLGW